MAQAPQYHGMQRRVGFAMQSYMPPHVQQVVGEQSLAGGAGRQRPAEQSAGCIDPSMTPIPSRPQTASRQMPI